MNDSIIGIIGAISGLIGVIVSSFVSIITLRKTLWNDHPRVRVELNRVIITSIKAEQYSIKVANIGTRPYTVTMIGFKIGKHSGGLAIPQPIGTVQVPYTLESGKTCDFWTSVKSIDKGIEKMTPRKQIKIRAYVKDYVGYNFNSRPHKVVLHDGKLYEFKTNFKKVYNELAKKIVP